jgi:RNA polymerase sigma-70 factor (ECF subfamily)
MASEPVSGDEFAAWVSPHVPVMGYLAARLVGPSERDDVVQEALVRAWSKRHTFDPDRGTPRVWLLAIVADRARRLRARRKDEPLLAKNNRAVVNAEDGGAVDLERAVATLPPRMRMTIDCVYFVGLTVAETADVMGVSTGTVKSTLSDARERLRSALEVRS